MLIENLTEKKIYLNFFGVGLNGFMGNAHEKIIEGVFCLHF